MEEWDWNIQAAVRMVLAVEKRAVRPWGLDKAEGFRLAVKQRGLNAEEAAELARRLGLPVEPSN